jgi:hypothetical protein
MSVTAFGNFLETKRLMNYAFNSFTVRQVAGKSQALCQYAVKNGNNDVVLRPAEDVWVLLPFNFDNTMLQYHNIVEASVLKAPVAVSDKLGILQIRFGVLILGNCDLVAMNPVAELMESIKPAERIPVENGKIADQWDWLLPIIGIAVIVIAVLALLVFLIIKLWRNLQIRRQMSYRIRKRKRGR